MEIFKAGIMLESIYNGFGRMGCNKFIQEIMVWPQC